MSLTDLLQWIGMAQKSGALELRNSVVSKILYLEEGHLVASLSDDRNEMLELLKQYAAEKLSEHPQEKDETRDHHCEYYAEFLYQRTEQLKGGRQKEALAEINDEIENTTPGKTAHLRIIHPLRA